MSSKFITLHNGVRMPTLGYGTWLLDYVDLFLIHTPMGNKCSDERTMDIVNERCVPDPVDHLETWKGMEDVLNKGLTRAIGLSNFSIPQMQRILDNCSVKPHNIQVECHLYWPQFELHDFCKKHNISFTAYAPLGSPGRLTHPLTIIGMDVSKQSDPLNDTLVKDIAAKHGKSSGQAEGELLYNGLKKALDVGYRHIDTAYVYENEDIIGDVLKQWFDSGSGKREDIFITTKRSDGRITEAADRVDPLETWKGMEDVLNKGLTRAIGLSNFSVSQTQRILDRCSVKPHNVQVECHIYWPQFELHGFCKEQNISFTAYTSLGNPGRHARLRARIGANVTKLEEPLNDTTVKDIAAKHGKSPAQTWKPSTAIVRVMIVNQEFYLSDRLGTDRLPLYLFSAVHGVNFTFCIYVFSC
ncbi:oxidoreductase, aldo/keto reductase family protein [Trichuris suis]|nr:oxidoreductase, aldo/keto reductase family protein [Trichuris suis]